MLYLIGSNPRGPIKIGRADNPKKRLSDLQVGSERPLILFAEGTAYTETMDEGYLDDVEVPDKEAERLIHERFSDRRLRGEWFEVSADEIVNVTDHLYPAIEYVTWGHPWAGWEAYMEEEYPELIEFRE